MCCQCVLGNYCLLLFDDPLPRAVRVTLVHSLCDLVRQILHVDVVLKTSAKMSRVLTNTQELDSDT